MKQYELREEHFAHQLKTKDLECQLAEAKYAQEVEKAKADNAELNVHKERAELSSATEVKWVYIFNGFFFIMVFLKFLNSVSFGDLF